MPRLFGSSQNQNHWSNHLLLKIANIVGAIFVMGGNVYTVISPSDVYYTGKETYFTPAPWSFFVWPLIHMLILGTCIYQFSGRGREIILERIGWRLPLLDFLNAMYIYSWTTQEYRYALVFILFAVSVVTHIYKEVKDTSLRNFCDEIFLHLPFSLYHGWTVGLIFLSAFEAFGVNAVTEPADAWTRFFVFISLLLLQTIAFAYAYSAIEGDLPACLVISWFLFALVVQQPPERSPFIHWSALGFAILSLCWVMRCVIGLELKFRGRNNRLGIGEETSRLLGGHGH
ncbi:hypothetical protein F5I97DRAFT_1937823 [Phlebopus sp. FC_14]|nr:hypothetical protein F5I97DRAFT_1937823 [Phlebopus sp. FC_14]